MKKNGFMLAEVLIVSTLLIGVMVFMYAQINTLTTNYNRAFKYNTVDGLYGAKIIEEFLYTENNYKNITTTKFVNQNEINQKTYFNALVNELGISKIIITNNSANVYDFLKRNYDNANSYSGKTDYYENLISFSGTLTSDNNNRHIIIAYNDDTYCYYGIRR